MRTNTEPVRKLILYCFLLLGVCIGIYADDPTVPLRGVTANWKPDFEHEAMILTVKNAGSEPIKVSSVLEVVLLPLDPNITISIDKALEREPHVIYPSLEFTQLPNGGFPEGEGGPEDFEEGPPIEIKSGETKEITLKFLDNTFSMVKESAMANCVLRYDHKELSRMIIKKDRGIWK